MEQNLYNLTKAPKIYGGEGCPLDKKGRHIYNKVERAAGLVVHVFYECKCGKLTK